MWHLIKLRIKTQNNGYWLETIDLSYILLEIELRLLLSSKAGCEIVSTKKIVEKDFLIKLANVAKDKEFIDETLWQRIKDFNEIRRKAIHGLAQGKISYDELEKYCKDVTPIIGDIQNRFLPMTFGKVEKIDD